MEPRRIQKFAALRLALAALAMLAPLPTASAQNCSNTSTGLVPLNDLGSGTYQGSQGGLYPGGTNVRPFAHTVGGLAQAAQIVPRDAAGNPSAPSAGGRIVFLSIGMSNCTMEFSRFAALANADPLKAPAVRLVDGAQGGQTASIIQNPNASFWAVVEQRLAAAGATDAQVQAIWFKEADAGPTNGWPAYAQSLRSEFETIMGVLHSKFPNARQCYLASRIYAGYATSALNPEPYSYEQGFSCKWTIEDQINGLAALNYDPAHGAVASPWIDWGTYNWADGILPRSDGLTWQCTDFVSDGTHPSDAGRQKVAQLLLDLVHAEPTAASWYLASPAPAPYGIGKTTSIGTLPSVGWTGTPSFASNDFAFAYTNACSTSAARRRAGSQTPSSGCRSTCSTAREGRAGRSRSLRRWWARPASTRGSRAIRAIPTGPASWSRTRSESCSRTDHQVARRRRGRSCAKAGPFE
jgi:hypothetical protein